MNKIISELTDLMNNEKNADLKKAMNMCLIQLRAINEFLQLREAKKENEF